VQANRRPASWCGGKTLDFLEAKMNSKKLLAVVVVFVSVVVGSIAIAESSRDRGGAQAEFALPPGWTAEDMQAMIEASTLGAMHKRLAEDVGTWRGETTMWMFPGAEPMKSESTSIVTPVMDGRYTKVEMKGEMPGMGPYHGYGLYGYDNVAKQFVSTWIDNHSTGIASGVGELSEDGKTLTWRFEANCPITKKSVTMREVETTTGPNSKTLEMWGVDPKSGKEFKMMSIALTRE
jgi:hypothetical protein